MTPTRIFLADDDIDDQLLFNEFLAHRNDIELMPFAENGVVLFEALDSILNSNELPHLIILDQNMPKRNGLHTLKLLKEKGRYHTIPVVVYSTYADHQLIKTCTAEGASAVLPKPFTKDGYDKMIDACLKLVAE